MITYISILRGINVSGHRMIKMETLKKLCAGLKFENVHTYIQSGNIIFNFKETDNKKISNLLTAAIEKTFGFDVPVITMTHAELEKTIKSNPFVKDKRMDSSFFHITFCSDIPAKENIALLKQKDIKNDKYEVANSAIYLYCPDNYSNSKLTNSFLEKKLKVMATTRNWKTVNELVNIAKKISQ
jgi:uncharacterized protein (DUF1697 family)